VTDMAVILNRSSITSQNNYKESTKSSHLQLTSGTDTYTRFFSRIVFLWAFKSRIGMVPREKHYFLSLREEFSM
jgi:hypothetical protein